MALVTFLVEDSKTIRDSLVPALEEMTVARVVGTAETEERATKWLSSHDGSWDLAIVDMFLKESSGMGVLEGCQERETHQRVIVLTNYATAEIRARALALGADAVFDKSTELDQLVAYCQSQE